jgi:hypothetical protein
MGFFMRGIAPRGSHPRRWCEAHEPHRA